MPISRSIEHTDVGVMPPRPRVTPPEPEQVEAPPVEEPVVEDVAPEPVEDKPAAKPKPAKK